MNHRFVWAWLLAGALLMFCGCAELEEALEDPGYEEMNPNSVDYRPKFVLGVFAIVQYPRATELERQIDMPNGRSVWVNTNQSFSSKGLREVKVVPRPGNPDVCDLQFRLSRRGKGEWEMLAARFRGEAVVLAVDGRGVGKFVPDFPNGQRQDWVDVRVGIDAYTAQGIAKYAKSNYDYYNPDSGSWWKWLTE